MNGVAETYERFAENEACGVSPIYEACALGVAQDPEVCTLIWSLPRSKRQPNLVFAVARLLGVPEQGYGQLRDWLVSNWAEVVPVVLARSPTG